MAKTGPEFLPLGPLVLVPKQQTVVWGGDLLHTRLGKPDLREPVGESWEIWEDDPVATGPHKGRTLRDLTQELPVQVLGTVGVSRGLSRFPLLVKFIDAEQPLSVQVHPNDTEARRLEEAPYGKTEAWNILEAKPDAWVILGLTEPLDAAAMRQKLEAGTAADILRKVRVKAGDIVFVPAGTVHAIGPGILLHEIQETSDITYRLYDWNRGEEGGKRELHLDKGLEVARLTPARVVRIGALRWQEDGTDVELVLASYYFTVKRLHLTGGYSLNTRRSSFHIVSIVEGSAEITSNEGMCHVPLGGSALVPAGVGAYRLESEKSATVLLQYLSDPEELHREVADRDVDSQAAREFFDQFETR